MGVSWKPEVFPLLCNGEKRLADALKTVGVAKDARSVFVKHSRLQDAGVSANGRCELYCNIKPLSYDKGLV